MTERYAKINVRKAGGKASLNTYKYQFTMPALWARELELSRESRNVYVKLDSEEQQLVIIKASEEKEVNDTLKLLKVNVRDDGHHRNYLKFAIDLPPLWMKQLGFNLEERTAYIILSSEQEIILKKA